MEQDFAVTLRDGTRSHRPLVTATMLALGRLAEKDPIGVYEAVMMARDRHHVRRRPSPTRLYHTEVNTYLDRNIPREYRVVYHRGYKEVP